MPAVAQTQGLAALHVSTSVDFNACSRDTHLCTFSQEPFFAAFCKSASPAGSQSHGTHSFIASCCHVIINLLCVTIRLLAVDARKCAAIHHASAAGYTDVVAAMTSRAELVSTCAFAFAWVCACVGVCVCVYVCVRMCVCMCA
jgi:divalent metal cation (Fe/Co/Zn/Cd) transporter